MGKLKENRLLIFGIFCCLLTFLMKSFYTSSAVIYFKCSLKLCGRRLS